MEALAVKGWSKDKLPSDLPEYTEGSIINSWGSNKEFYLKIEKTQTINSPSGLLIVTLYWAVLLN